MATEVIELPLLTPAELIAIHDRLILRYGGLPGVKDHGALQSVLKSPQVHIAYRNPNPRLPELAAVMAYEIVKQHPFNDANKRTAAVVIPVFMRAHGIQWRPRYGDLVEKMLMMAKSAPNEEARWEAIDRVAHWICLSHAEYVS